MDKHSIGAAAVRHLLRPRAGSCLRFEQKGIGRQELGAGNTATSLSKHGASVHTVTTIELHPSVFTITEKALVVWDADEKVC